MLKLMYITNDPAVAKIAADAGVDRIFIDMEVLGKAERQGGMDTVQSHHTPEDIAKVRAAIGDQAEIMARVNPLNPNSQTEIDDAIANGADVIMLPMWRTADDLRQLVSHGGWPCKGHAAAGNRHGGRQSAGGAGHTGHRPDAHRPQ